MQNFNCYVYCKRYFTDLSLRIAKCFIDFIEVICSLWMLIKGPYAFLIYTHLENVNQYADLDTCPNDTTFSSTA